MLTIVSTALLAAAASAGELSGPRPLDVWGASIPLWPLLAAVAVGLALATGILRKHCDKLVIAGVAASAVLSLGVFSQIMTSPATVAIPERSPSSASKHEMINAAGERVGASDSHGKPAEAADGHGSAAEEHAGPRIALTRNIYNWISFGTESSAKNQWIAVNFYVDPLTGMMLLVVTLVALMVVLYSTGYMRDHHGHQEQGYERFFAFLGLFVFSMLMLVLAGNFVLLYLGWELVGLCSYLLIGFYFHKPEAASAAKKAFLVNRIGDFGFALGIFALYAFISPLAQAGENPLDYATVFKYVEMGALSEWQVTTVALLLLCGALGKSAQFPLYVWLPDAMEGPTPVSALIHAATMVTAGVYMVARCGPIYSASPTAQFVVILIGVIGAVLAATMAMAQYDMKRILAYSTMSQLAFMFVALGCSAPHAAIFHLYTHAFFKALLFLTAGSVMHAMGGIIDVRRFSGLKDVLPRTYILCGIGCLALAGVPGLAGFFSKDEILHAAFGYSPILGVIMLATAGLTAYYTFRMFFLCFHGPLRTPEEAGHHIHESPISMIGPLVPLAIGAVFAGYIGVPWLGNFYAHFVEPTTMIQAVHHIEWLPTWLLMVISGAVGLIGIALAYVRYGSAPQEDPDRAVIPGWGVLHAKYYVDEIYDAVFVKPLREVGRVFFATDRNGIDNLLLLISWIPQAIGGMARMFQRGALQGYALGMVGGLALILVLWKWLEAKALAG